MLAVPVGQQLREWRRRRRLSQLDLALDAGISTRHLSFIETGRARASREMIALLAEQLEVPLRERNLLFVAAGYAPPHYELPLDHPELTAARRAVELILKGHEPYPALAVDRQWNMVSANAAARLFIADAAPHLLEPPVNVLRLSLHPEGLAGAILNLGEWKAHLVERLQRQVAQTGDEGLSQLLAELSAYPAPDDAAPTEPNALFVPMRLASPVGELSFISTTTMFGTPLEVTLSELAIEAFFPADAETSERLRMLTSATA
jgi:transcriptional regulator with XRE-family HTH domain